MKTKSLNKDVWDARRLIASLLEYGRADCDGIYIEKDFPEDSLYAIRINQLLSVLKAYGASVEFVENSKSNSGAWHIKCQTQPLSLEYAEKASKLLASHIDISIDYLEELFVEQPSPFSDSFCQNVFASLFMYRQQLLNLANFWNSYLEVPKGFHVSYKFTTVLYQSIIGKMEKTLDHLLSLLMGQQYEATFTVPYLTEHFNYPNISEKDLADMEFDWL